jgi:hypothetical protein
MKSHDINITTVDLSVLSLSGINITTVDQVNIRQKIRRQ